MLKGSPVNAGRKVRHIECRDITCAQSGEKNQK